MSAKHILLVILSSTASGCTSLKTQIPQAPAAKAPATSPTTKPGTQEMARDVSYIFWRTGWYHGSLVQFQQEYLVKEGYTHRGKRFERLARAIDFSQKMQTNMTEYELLVLLGPPDYGDAGRGGSQLVYVFDRAGNKDQYMEFNFGADSKLEHVSWIERTRANQGRYYRFPVWKVVPDFGPWL